MSPSNLSCLFVFSLLWCPTLSGQRFTPMVMDLPFFGFFLLPKQKPFVVNMDLDQWISKVKDGQHLLEDELQLLYVYVLFFLWFLTVTPKPSLAQPLLCLFYLFFCSLNRNLIMHFVPITFSIQAFVLLTVLSLCFLTSYCVLRFFSFTVLPFVFRDDQILNPSI